MNQALNKPTTSAHSKATQIQTIKYQIRMIETPTLSVEATNRQREAETT
jgi:hypothetical protein